MKNENLYSMFLLDLTLVEQELLSGGQQPDDVDGDFEKDKEKEKQKDKNITNFSIAQQDISGSVEINLSISM